MPPYELRQAHQMGIALLTCPLRSTGKPRVYERIAEPYSSPWYPTAGLTFLPRSVAQHPQKIAAGQHMIFPSIRLNSSQEISRLEGVYSGDNGNGKPW